MSRHSKAMQLQELCAGVIASTTANFSMNTPDRWLKPSDFFGNLQEPEPQVMEGEDVLAVLQGFYSDRHKDHSA